MQLNSYASHQRGIDMLIWQPNASMYGGVGASHRHVTFFTVQTSQQ